LHRYFAFKFNLHRYIEDLSVLDVKSRADFQQLRKKQKEQQTLKQRHTGKQQQEGVRGGRWRQLQTRQLRWGGTSWNPDDP
jgi:hypothetical protein